MAVSFVTQIRQINEDKPSLRQYQSPQFNLYKYQVSIGLLNDSLVWFSLILWHIKHCWLFNAKSILSFIYTQLIILSKNESGLFLATFLKYHFIK